jgi:DNA-binding transcriptional LysR family regulator
MHELRERRVDLVVMRLYESVPEARMDVEVLFEDPLVIVAGAQNRWSRRRKITLADLVNEPWTWPPPEDPHGAAIIESFRVSGLDPSPAVIYTHAVDMRIGLAMGGRFLTVLPASMLLFPVRHPSLKMVPVELPNTRRPTAIITLKNRTLSPVAQRFLESARKIAKPLA